MQLYVKLWRARPDWLELTRQERAEFVARCGSAFSAASNESELIGFGLDESEGAGAGEYRYVAVWRIHTGSAAERLDAALQRLQWNRYFEGIDSLTPLVAPESFLGDMGTSEKVNVPREEPRRSGGFFSKLARGLGIKAEPEAKAPLGEHFEPRAPEPPPRPVFTPPQPEPVVEVAPRPVAPVVPVPIPVVVIPEPEPALVTIIEEAIPFEIEEPVEEIVVAPEPQIEFESARLSAVPEPASDPAVIGDGINVDAYLERIGYSGSREPTAETLRELHRAHLRSVPFENLDIMSGQSIVLDEKSFQEKIVGRRRGGFCYELNGLFAALLRELGFNVTLISGNVTREDGSHGPDFDHLAIMVRLEERWLVDVGFGDSFSEPLRIDERGEQFLPDGTYRIYNDAGLRSLLRRSPDMTWKEQFIFTLLPRELSDFASMCDFHQTSPKSPFTHRRICSRFTTDGRVSLTDTHLILSSGGKRRELQLSNKAEYKTILREYFGIFTAE